MTYPLEGLRHIEPDHAKAAEKYRDKQLVRDYIDIGWMHQKGLKWIGWDIQGWLAWTDPNGMLYRIKDLKRNEDGVAFEKEVNEVKSEQKPRMHMGNPSAEALYRFERDMQKDCGFCPGDRRGSVDAEIDQEPGMDATPKEEEEINLDDLMKGDISPFVPGGYNGVVDQEEITTTAFVVYSEPVLNPVIPPKQAPTGSGKAGTPDLPTSPTDTRPVTKTPPGTSSHYGPPRNSAPGNPASQGTYGVTPTYGTKPPGFVNNSNDTYWVKPETDYDKNGRKVSQNDPAKDSKVTYWSSGAYPVPPGGTFPNPIDGYTKQGSGTVNKVDDLNNSGIVVDRNGAVHGIGWNIRGGVQSRPANGDWQQLFDRSK